MLNLSYIKLEVPWGFFKPSQIFGLFNIKFHFTENYLFGLEYEDKIDEPVDCSSDHQQSPKESKNLDKTSKAGLTRLRKKIVFNEKSGHTSFASSRIDFQHDHDQNSNWIYWV